jgi:hypothetical protein
MDVDGCGDFFPPGGPGIQACKRAKPLFSGVFAFSKRAGQGVWHASKSGFGPMFIGFGTLSRLAEWGAGVVEEMD